MGSQIREGIISTEDTESTETETQDAIGRDDRNRALIPFVVSPSNHKPNQSCLDPLRTNERTIALPLRSLGCFHSLLPAEIIIRSFQHEDTTRR